MNHVLAVKKHIFITLAFVVGGKFDLRFRTYFVGVAYFNREAIATFKLPDQFGFR